MKKKDTVNTDIRRPHVHVISAADLPELFKTRYASLGFTKDDVQTFDTDVARLRAKFDVFSMHGEMHGDIGDMYIVSDADFWT